MSLDLSKGMECPACGVKKGFTGGRFGLPVIQTNFICDCGFSAINFIDFSEIKITAKTPGEAWAKLIEVAKHLSDRKE